MSVIEGTDRMTHRRDILRSCLRYGGVLALGGIAASLGWRGRHGQCQHPSPCGGCPMFGDCALPKALDTKGQLPPAPKPGAAKPTLGHV